MPWSNLPKAMLTARQGFLTEEALQQTARSLLNQFTFHESQRTASTYRASML